jgi:uncharacterized protein
MAAHDQAALDQAAIDQAAIDQAVIVHWLGQPHAYPHRPDRVEHIETHISHVFLAGDLVYKLKKPARYDFLDYTTLAQREQACRDELRLNRRLAPAAYLRVVPITIGKDSGYELGGPGNIVDWLVEMRRLPTDQTLEALLARGELTPPHIDRLAGTLVNFYRDLPPVAISADQYRDRIFAHVRGNLDELLALKHHLPHSVVERIHGFQLQLLHLRPELFDQRVRAGRVVEGHGDLRPQHICLSDPIAIFDCIEFSADFRRLDVADEMAFLAAECDFLRAPWIGPQLLAAYSRATGDVPPAVLVDFYKSYRACVRAKVATLRADQLTGPEQQSATAEAHAHLALADQCVTPWLRPLVLCIGGLSGSGKTTLAAAAAAALGAEHLRTDLIRKQLFAARPAAPTSADLYTLAARDRVYDELLSAAAQVHGQQISVVLDATFSSAAHLARAEEIAAAPRSVFLAVECHCRPEIARQRIEHRLAAGRDPSDARREVHDLQRQQWQPWPPHIPHLRIDTEHPPAAQLTQLFSALRAHAK